MMGKPFLFCH